METNNDNAPPAILIAIESTVGTVLGTAVGTVVGTVVGTASAGMVTIRMAAGMHVVSGPRTAVRCCCGHLKKKR